ncbi:MAG: adenosylcobinamide-GDP ribazoletransferase, partial [Nitratireductor sp.]
MKDLIAYIKVCVEFFTRIPVKRSKEESTISLNEAAIAFPIIGLFIGALIGLIWLIASYFLPTIVAAGIAIIGGIMLTGALHEDGISDCADGLGGHVSTKRALEIMRDSNIGTYGAVALIATIGFRWTG